MMKAIIVGLSISSTSAIHLKEPAKVTSPVAVAMPPATTATLPEAHNSLKELSCKKLDACLAENGGDDHKKATEALKHCIFKSLGDQRGQKVWAVLEKAKLEAKKKSLALLKVSRPDTYKAILQALFAEGVKVLHAADLCLADEPEIPKHLRSPFHVPVPKAPNVALAKPPNGHPQAAGSPAKAAAPPAPKPVPVPDAPSDCDKGKGLPTPHGHPQAAAKDKETNHKPPATCKKLDLCIAKIDSNSYAAGYKKCVQNFCQELHGDKDFKKKDDPRTTLCDKKGQEALDIFAKASADAKKLTLAQTKPPVIALGAVTSLFTKISTSAQIEHACQE